MTGIGKVIYMQDWIAEHRPGIEAREPQLIQRTEVWDDSDIPMFILEEYDAP